MTTDTERRRRIVDEARSWKGTPYRNCADIKGVGVDCGMLLLRVYVDCGLFPAFDPRPYPHDFHLHRGEEWYRRLLEDRGRQVGAPQIGDAILFKVGRIYSHGSIVTSVAPLTVVHAVREYRAVVEEEIDPNQDLRERMKEALIFDLVGFALQRKGGAQ